MQLTFRRMTSLMKYKPNTQRNTIHSTKLIYIFQGPQRDKNSSHGHRVSEWWTDVKKKKKLVDDTGASGEHERTITKLSSLGKGMKFKSPEETYLFCLPTKESEIIDFFLQYPFKMRVKTPYQPAHAGLWTRLKALSSSPGCKVLQGGSHCIQRVIILDTFSIILVGRSY